ncbi:pre-mRNA-processing protein 40C isoform X2 [Ananas comosus]|uniref:Pre-mRNA-processing protein 40C isoform X2 n=1 Tax=Ananas comosus TaxID=4615 RepID=A0A6P5FFX3_ANACO|nr:pre-mRNA-processing protein 40C isoform X2 [Ananas comosus]
MSTSARLSQEEQSSASTETPISQIVESPIGGQNSTLPPSVSTSLTSPSPIGGPTSSTATQTASTPAQDSAPSTTLIAPITHAANPAAPRGILVNPNDPSQDPVRAKYAGSPGYVVPAPSFSYNAFPRVSPAVGSNQQSSPAPAFRLTPPMPPAALQPPVPGQYLGNRPSFSYNVVPHANSSLPTGQQFQLNTAANQAHLQSGNIVPQNTAVRSQPPVPMLSVRPNTIFSGPIMPNPPAPVRLPVPMPKGDPSKPSNFSFSSNSPQAPVEASEKELPSNTGAVALESGSSGTSVTSQPSSSSGTSVPNPSLVSSTTTSHSTTMTSPMRPLVPSSASLIHTSTSPTPVIQNVHQFYPTYPSAPAVVPPSQPPWVHTPQVGSLQRPPILPYAIGPPALFPSLMHGVPQSATPLNNFWPPGVSTNVSSEEPKSTSAGSQQIADSLVTKSPPTDHDKETSDLRKEEGTVKTEDADAWTAHRTESGVVYYYNSVTKESTYEKPAGFKGEPEKVSTPSVPVSWEKLPGTDWTLVTTNDGKKYYYDAKNKVSCWQLPPEIAELKKNQENDSLKENVTQLQNSGLLPDKGSATVSASAPAALTGGRDSVSLRTSGTPVSSSALDLIKKKLQDAGTPGTTPPPAVGSGTSDLNGSKAVEAAAKGQQVSNNKDKPRGTDGDGLMSESSSDSDDEESGPTKEECIIQFKEMLKERGVAPFSKWEKELPKIVFDPRFKAIPSYSARRAIFEHYVRTRAEEERKEKRAAQKAAMEAFKQLLEEASEDIDHKTDYRTFKRKWGSDPRFEALDRKERELLFNEKVKAADENFKAIRMATITSFKSMLQESGDITLNSRWSKVKDNFRNDPRYKAVNHEEREILFNEHITELKSAEDEAERSAKSKMDEQEKLRERERETRKRKEREEQEMERVRLKIRKKEAIASYQALLVEAIKDPKASWTESKPKLEKDPQCRATNPDLGQGDAEKLFREHIKELCERCAREYRTLLSEIITPEAAAQPADDGKTVLTSWSEAKRILKPDPRYSKLPSKDRESIWRRYADDMIRKQKQKSDSKEKPDTNGRNRTSTDPSRRSNGWR